MADKNDEAMKNCGFCKKPVMKAKKFYRNNKYYCNPNCWRKAKEKAAQEAAEAATAES